MNEAIKRLLKALREKRGGTTYSTIKSEHAENWFRLLVSYLYEAAGGSVTVCHYEFGNHHGGLDNCVVRWLFHCWWREQALDLLGSVYGHATSRWLGWLTTTESISRRRLPKKRA